MITLDDLVASPLDDELRLVYADQQQRAGDPRGELAVVQHRLRQDPTDLELRERESWLLAEHGGALLGSFGAQCGRLAESDDRQVLGVTWHLGFIRRARLQLTNWGDDHTQQLQLLSALMQSPSAALLEQLEVRVRSAWTRSVRLWHFVDELIALGARPALRVFEIGGDINWLENGDAYPDRDISAVYIGKVGRLWPLYPNLEKIRIRGNDVQLAPELVLPRLRVFELCGSGLGREGTAVLERATWPALERLVLWFGSGEYSGEDAADWDDVAKLLASLEARCPRLAHLALANSICTDEILETLAAAPPADLLARLRGLDLSLGTLGRQGVASLIALQPHLRGLTSLNVAGGYLDSGSLARLREAWPACKILDGGQRTDADRYCAVSE